MKIVCFDSPYSNYFRDLTDEIEVQLGGKCKKEFVNYNKCYSIYLSGFKFVKLKPCTNFEFTNYSFVGEIKSLTNISGKVIDDKVLNSMISLYVSLENYILENRDAIYFMYNDLRCLNAFAIDILCKNNITYYVFERGAFRPYSTTMDTLGVNANSSFSNKDFNKFSCDKKVKLDRLFFKERKDKSIKLKFATFLLYKKIYQYYLRVEGFWFPTSQYNKSLFDYFRLYFSDFMSYFCIIESRCDNFPINDEFVFIPLQLSNDTQTLINSRFNSTQEFIDKITRDYENLCESERMNVVFKIHPLDVEKYNIDKRFYVSRLSTDYLINKASACITINSTVGFESLMNKKSVICAGRSFYTNHGMLELREEGNLLSITRETIRDQTVESYKYFVLSEYQVPGSVYNYEHQDLIYTANKILSRK